MCAGELRAASGSPHRDPGPRPLSIARCGTLFTGSPEASSLTCCRGDAHLAVMCTKGLRHPRTRATSSLALPTRPRTELGTHGVLGQHLGSQDLRPLLPPAYSQNGEQAVATD